MESATIIPIILTSDKTHLSGSGSAKAWPLFITIGNISNNIRFSPGYQCAQLIALIPIIHGDYLTKHTAKMSGIEIHHETEEFRHWSRSVVHAVIRDVMAPIERVMQNGVRMTCADGAERLCFPLLCEYIGDMPEQWLLTCLVQPACTKCLYRGTPDANDLRFTRRNAVNKINQDLANNHPRTDTHALEHRVRYRNDESVPLRALGYHPQIPFSINYPFGTGIIDAVGPDLLHHISKCFMDYLMKEWIWNLMKITWKGRGFSKAQLKMEFDSRFALIPEYTGLQQFEHGVLTKTHAWTVHEYKEIMKVILGTLIGLCSSEGIHLVMEYLDVHQLAHYSCHTDESLAWLENAVDQFFEQLKSANGPFIKHGLVSPESETQKIHYQRHYANTVHEKGALPSSSTDRTEPLHKLLKNAWRRSNKGKDSIDFVLKEHMTLAAFQSHIDNFDSGGASEDVESDDSKMPGFSLKDRVDVR